MVPFKYQVRPFPRRFVIKKTDLESQIAVRHALVPLASFVAVLFIITLYLDYSAAGF